jgi:broad specificity phosphatase PhoE
VPTVILVRHGQASFGGSDYDVLSEAGVEQAAVLAEDLALRGTRIDRILSGTLGRQRGTAAPIAARFGHELAIDRRWDEYDSDDILEHHSTTAVRQDRPAGSDAPEVSSREFQVLLERALLEWIAAADTGPCREPFTVFAERVARALKDLGASLRSGETALVCTSGGVLAALCVGVLAVPPEAFVVFNRVTVNAGITRVAHGRAGATLISFNEQAHLLTPGRSLVTYR